MNAASTIVPAATEPRRSAPPAVWTSRVACCFLSIGALGALGFFTVRPTLTALRITAMIATWGFSGAGFLSLTAVAMAIVSRRRPGVLLALTVALATALWFISTALRPGRTIVSETATVLVRSSTLQQGIL